MVATDHAVMIDVLNAEKGPSARVALELSPGSARALANAILSTLDTIPTGLLDQRATLGASIDLIIEIASSADANEERYAQS